VSVGIGILFTAVALVIGIVAAKRWYDGQFRTQTPTAQTDDDERAPLAPERRHPVLTGADLDTGALGERATLVQFSTAFCAPCRATRQVLALVSEAVDGVRHVDIDAESHLDLVRKLRIRRTPTVLVLDSEGRVRNRASGQPRRAEVLAAVDAVISRDSVS
jgi:thiol-disulfide isomerase/thioredoxin